MRVAVFGASGFVGATLVERLWSASGVEVRPIIHSSANAWRLARHGKPLLPVDLGSLPSIRSALDGCTHVVNCSRGGDAVMLDGLANLLGTCRSAGIRRFVHLSSVAVYGDPPPPESVRENAPTNPEPKSYGWIKLQQDRMVEKAHARGLPSIILCPPNIGGPYSAFMLQVLAAIDNGQFALVEDGSAPCVLVDVRNLAHAIDLALRSPVATAERLFVTDDEPTTWRDIVTTLLPCLDDGVTVPTIGRTELAAAVLPARPQSPSLWKSVKHLGSSTVRAALREDPLLAKFDGALRHLTLSLPASWESRLKKAIEGPLPVSRLRTGPPYNVRLCAQQLRGVRHEPARAKEVLGYRPEISFAESASAFCAWYRSMHAVDKGAFRLLKAL